MRGNGFAQDQKLYVNGSPSAVETRFINQSELRALFPQHLFGAAGQVRIEVKTPGKEADSFSIPLNLNILQPPAPQYKMLAFISEADGSNPQALLQEGNKSLTVSVGQKLGAFKITSITPRNIDFEDISVAVGVTHTIRLPENSTSSGSSAISSYNSYQQSSYQQTAEAVLQAQPIAISEGADNPQLQEYDTGDTAHEYINNNPIDQKKLLENQQRYRQIYQQRMEERRRQMQRPPR